MDTAELKRIIQEQEEERKQILAGGVIERYVDAHRVTALLESYLNFPNILAILGIRRCGKSVLSWLLLEGKKKKYGYLNFDDESLYGMEAKDLNTVLKAFYELYGSLDFLILDEIQNVKGWELFASRLRRTKKVIITGSNSQLLSGELATHLTGRHIDFVLFPFSFREFCALKGLRLEGKAQHTTETAAVMENALLEYMEKGGLPESYKYGKPILKSIFGDIVSKDIMKRHSIRSGSIEGIAKYLVTNYSREISFNKLKGVFGIKNISTLKSYVKYFENAYLIFVLERFSFKLKEQIISPKKIYCIDTGIINAVSFRHSPNFGMLFENIVCTELFRRSAQSETGIFYWKNHQQLEVDFVIKQGLKVGQLIQVCYDIGDARTKERELKALLKAGGELRCKNLLIITSDYEAEEEVKGRTVVYKQLWKWLLGL